MNRELGFYVLFGGGTLAVIITGLIFLLTDWRKKRLQASSKS